MYKLSAPDLRRAIAGTKTVEIARSSTEVWVRLPTRNDETLQLVPDHVRLMTASDPRNWRRTINSKFVRTALMCAGRDRTLTVHLDPTNDDGIVQFGGLSEVGRELWVMPIMERYLME